jgi:hypothetical protein
MSNRPFLILLFAVAAVLAAISAGCGEMSKADYEKEILAITDDVQREAGTAGREIGSHTASEEDTRKSREALEDAAAKLEDIDPPSDVKGAHEDLTEGVKGVAKMLGRVERDGDELRKDPKLATEMVEEFTGEDSPMKRIEDAEKAYKQAGYTVFKS